MMIRSIKNISRVGLRSLLVAAIIFSVCLLPTARVLADKYDTFCVQEIDCAVYDPNACTTPAPTASPIANTGGPVFVIGDSITAASKAEFEAAFSQQQMGVTIDASSSRSLTGPGVDGNKLSGMEAIAKNKDKISNSSTVVIALGTNGGTTAKSIDDAIQAIGPDKSIYWVDTISVDRADDFNKSIVQPANRAIYGKTQNDKYSVISWFKAVNQDGDPEKPTAKEKDPNNYILPISQDKLGVHPTAKGSAALAKLVADTVGGAQAQTPLPSAQAACCGTDPSGGGDDSLSGNGNAEKVFNFFVGKGLTPEQAAGIVGNMQKESGIDPEIVQGGSQSKDPSAAGDGGWGIVQWTPGSKASAIKAAAGIDGPIYSLSVQLEMLWAQLDGKAGAYSEEQAGKELRSTTTVEDATRAFQGDSAAGGKYFGYERPADQAGSLPDRIASAKAALKQFGGNTVLAESSDSSGNGASCTCTTSSAGGSSTANKLSQTLKELADKNGGQTSLSVSSIDGNQKANSGGNVQMPTRSSYKLYTAYATLRAIEDGDISWSTKIWGNKSVADAMEAMIVKSDNGAAEALRLDKTIGSPAVVTKFLQDEVGLSSKTVMGSGDVNSAKGSNSRSTANDFVKFLVLLEKKRLPGVKKEVSYDRLIGFMKNATTDGGSARAGIASAVGGSEVADKPGWASGPSDPASNDVGIVYLKDRPYAVAILSDKPNKWDGVADMAKNINRAMGGSDEGDVTSGGCGSGSGAVSGDLIGTVKSYAWPDYYPEPYLKRKQAYAKAVTQAQKRGEYIGGTVGGEAGIDCGGFITRVMLDSGYEPEYNSNGKGGATGDPNSPSTQWGWLDKNWQKLNPKSTKDMEPGDVAINADHTYIYVGKVDGFNSVTASSSYSPDGSGGRSPMAGRETVPGTDFTWYRKK